MDEQKQIDEMTTIIYDTLHIPEIWSSGRMRWSKYLAECLYHRKYQKIPEGSVVLTEEEFWKLSNKFSKKELDEIVEFHKNKARKQAVKEILEAISEGLNNCFLIYDSGYHIQGYATNDVKNLINKLTLSKKPDFTNHTGDPDWN